MVNRNSHGRLSRAGSARVARHLWCAAVILAFLPAAVSAARLGDGAVPEHYDIRIEPHLDNNRFDAVTAARVRIARPTSRVVLNAVDLEFDAVHVQQDGVTQTAGVLVNSAEEQIIVEVTSPLLPGTAVIELAYRGPIRNDLRGFYRSVSHGRTYAITQFEPTDARRMFPSFDEPGSKATFALTTVIDDQLTAISNAPVRAVSRGPEPGQKTVQFETTAPMAPYLVALAVGQESVLLKNLYCY